MPGARLEYQQCLKVLAIQISILLPSTPQAPKSGEEQLQLPSQNQRSPISKEL